MKQSASALLMIRPVRFGYNEQTAGSNAFQNKVNAAAEELQAKALNEFDGFVNILKQNGVAIIVVDDTVEPHKPDSIFPNNWVSFHENGDVLMYPMQAHNRRLERREDIIRRLEKDFTVTHIIDLSRFELSNQFLEGTGSMVLDRENRIIYACLSPRTDTEVLKVVGEHEGYTALTFNAVDQNNQPIYHTNVLMCIGSGFVVICLESIKDEAEKKALLHSFGSTQKEVIEISFEQMKKFAGNMLEVENSNGEKLIVMSQQAYGSLSEEQVSKLSDYAKIVYADISTIETIGGGSARCMLAEVHLPHRDVVDES